MSEEEKKGKLEFTAEGEAFGYISLDQARVRIIEHARDNRDVYGSSYSRGDLVWVALNQEESKECCGTRLSYQPASGFVGKMEIHQLTIDKDGPIALRQILSYPKPDPRTRTILACLGLVVLIIAIAGGLAAAGVFLSFPCSELVIDPTESVAIFVVPEAPAQLLSSQVDVTIDVGPGTSGATDQLTYEPISIGDLPTLADVYRATGTIFDVTLSEPLLKAITITARLSSVDELLAGINPVNVITQHYHNGTRELLETKVDFAAATAEAQVDQLSLFALTIR